jgi:hypothetical protein
MEGPGDRDLAKTPVMSWLYGSQPGGFTEDGEPYGVTRAVIEELRERIPPTGSAKRSVSRLFKSEPPSVVRMVAV